MNELRRLWAWHWRADFLARLRAIDLERRGRAPLNHNWLP